MNAEVSVIWLSLVMLTGAAEAGSEDTHLVAPPALKQSEIIAGLRSVDAATQTSMATHLRWQRRQTVSSLYRVVQGGVSHAEQHQAAKTAMEMLGEFRCDEAVPLLIDNIKFTVGGVGKVIRGGPFADMPAIPALIHIGLPSLDPLLKRVGETDDEVIRERAAIVVNQVLGTDLALVFVGDRRDREPYEPQRQRLARLVEQIDKVERNRRIQMSPMKPPPLISPQPK